MSGTKTRTCVFAATLVLMMLGALFGATGVANAKDLLPAENPVINYPAYPLGGGLYITAATYNPDGPRIVLVFNESIDDASLDTPEVDFVSETLDLTEMSYSAGSPEGLLGNVL